MAENTNAVPQVPTPSDDEAAGFALEAQALGNGEPARVDGTVQAAAAGDASEMLGEVLQSQELNPSEPAVTNDPVPMQAAGASCTPTGAGYAAQGRALEQEAVAQTYPGQPAAARSAAPYYIAPEPQPAPQPGVAASQAAYQAAYGAPAVGTTPAAAPAAPSYNPQAAVTAAALQQTRKTIDPRRVFLICGMVVGAIMIVFGLCMLAFYTPAEVNEFYSSSHQAFASSGATAAQVLKAGFAMLLIGLGAADICAFGSKLFKRHGCKRDER
ncbi:hypothetical protein VJ918_10460 [Adlercreutzia sp. R21]|uniref:hypothetical protein n=1 Tax=Adlercreutzia wanghongyangiae TaxID=3111451 RepID=UPI002DBBE0F3|nr:hypothetical protein [Adlercreutzia sp. R21]MEC4185232.1 hypothetical protein [Adlercreutzia sp. R21]